MHCMVDIAVMVSKRQQSSKNNESDISQHAKAREKIKTTIHPPFSLLPSMMDQHISWGYHGNVVTTKASGTRVQGKTTVDHHLGVATKVTHQCYAHAVGIAIDVACCHVVQMSSEVNKILL